MCISLFQFIFVALVTFFVDLIEIRVYYKPFEEENGDGDSMSCVNTYILLPSLFFLCAAAVERTWKFSAGYVRSQ